MSAPSPYYVTQTPQREFATAKIVIFLYLCKFAKHILQKMLIITLNTAVKSAVFR